MKKLILALAVIGTIGAAGTIVAPQPAAAQERFSFSFDTGNIFMGYRDGYYDRDRRWHRWRNAREAREFRMRYRDRYRDRYGWRDRDYDGVPNRYDRDRDGDGVPNRWDARPNNPWRD